MKKVISSGLLPKLLLCLLLLCMMATVFLEANQYDITPDEALQDSYGHSVLSWYTSFGKDTSFLSYAPELYMPQHGPFFETVVAAAQQLFGNHWYSRAVVNGLAGLIGVVAVALCGYEIGGPWLALLAAFMLWMYPRYSGALYNNSKDIPFAGFMALTLWAALRLVKRWEKGSAYILSCILVGACIGMAASIRVTAVLWYLLLLLALAWWWVQHGWTVLREKRVLAALKQQALAASILIAVSFVTMLALWPYVLLDPVTHLFESIQVMQRYPWNGGVLFGGVLYQGQHLPWTYVPIWLAIGSPLIIIACMMLGVLLSIKTPFTQRSDPMMLFVLLAFAVPIGLLIVMHATLYDGPRQFLFLIPPLALLAAFGLVRLVDLLLRWGRRLYTALAIALVLVTCINYAVLGKVVSDLHPYEYAYFNILVGGVSGASGKYDVDYWRVCSKPAAEWLAQHYQAYTHKAHPTVTSLPIPQQALLYLPGAFQEDDVHPDFYIGSTKDGFDKKFSDYKLIHSEYISGTDVLACVVKLKLS